TASFFFDESAKVIYVSPKVKGFLGGLSFSPDADENEGEFKQLVQAGLTYEKYWRQNVFRVGGSYAFANGVSNRLRALALDDLYSYSGGASVTLDDALTLGASFTYNGDSGLPRGPGRPFDSDAFGYAASVNYNKGAWTLGGYYQRAIGEGDNTASGNDQLQALEMGTSYRVNTRVRIYGAGYFYRLDDEGGSRDSDRFTGSVFMLGIRLAL
ncbi:MAG: porin, partial [Burkholderiales bacterium]